MEDADQDFTKIFNDDLLYTIKRHMEFDLRSGDIELKSKVKGHNSGNVNREDANDYIVDRELLNVWCKCVEVRQRRRRLYRWRREARRVDHRLRKKDVEALKSAGEEASTIASTNKTNNDAVFRLLRELQQKAVSPSLPPHFVCRNPMFTRLPVYHFGFQLPFVREIFLPLKPQRKLAIEIRQPLLFKQVEEPERYKLVEAVPDAKIDNDHNNNPEENFHNTEEDDINRRHASWTDFSFGIDGVKLPNNPFGQVSRRLKNTKTDVVISVSKHGGEGRSNIGLILANLGHRDYYRRWFRPGPRRAVDLRLKEVDVDSNIRLVLLFLKWFSLLLLACFFALLIFRDSYDYAECSARSKSSWRFPAILKYYCGSRPV